MYTTALICLNLSIVIFLICIVSKIYFHSKYGNKLDQDDKKIDVFLAYLKKGAFLAVTLLIVAIVLSATYGIKSN